jgi:hypothetical protein
MFEIALACPGTGFVCEPSQLHLQECVGFGPIDALEARLGFGLERCGLNRQPVCQIASLIGIRCQSQRRKRQSRD